MQRQVLQALVDGDLVRTNRLRSVAKQDFRSFRLFFGRANAHQQDELAANQLSFKMPDALACKRASHLGSDPPGSKGPNGRGTAGPYQLSPRLDDEPCGKSGAGED
jgi:hypothetical protein